MQHKKDFIRVVKENEGIIFKVSKFYTNNTIDQEDLYQEIVYQLWKYYKSFRGDAKISTWIYRIALNTSIAHLNKEKRKPKELQFEALSLSIADEKDTLLEERLNVLHQHIKALNEIERGLILLFLEGKPYEEIAGITGFTTSNVGTRIARIKKKLKEKII